MDNLKGKRSSAAGEQEGGEYQKKVAHITQILNIVIGVRLKQNENGVFFVKYSENSVHLFYLY